MNWFTILVDALTFLGSPAAAALVKKLEAAGADALAVWQAVANNAGLVAIETALQKLLTDLTAS